MFDKFKLRQRILLGCTLPLIVLLACMGLIFFNLQEATRAAAKLEHYRYQEDGAYQINVAVLSIQRAVRGYLLLKDFSNRKGFDENEEVLRSQEKLLHEIRDPQQADILRRLLDVTNEFSHRNRQILDLMETGRSAEAISRFRDDDNLQRTREEARQLANRFLQGAKDLRQQQQDKFNAAIEAVSQTMLFGTIGSVAAAFAVIWWMATVLSRRISGYAAHLAAAATEIAATITQHESTAGQQAAAANETSVTIEELSASSRQSAEQAASMASLAGDATRSTEEGAATASHTVAAMAELREKITRMSDHIVNLNEQVGQIGTIATLVRDLAGEINMLALNAAVEASRAGEHGKGFAVVAAEVRKLADQSRRSAEQAGSLITDIQKSTASSIMMTEDSSRMVSEVTRQAEQVGSLFERLAEMVNHVSMSAQQVMLNAQQQATAFNQVVEATNSISAGARETAAGITQTKNAVDQLNHTAQSLKAMA